MRDVSVVVCSRDRPEQLRATVGAILASPDVPAEIVVVDQSDAPTLLEVPVPAAACALHYLHEPGRGASRARNRGAAAARSPILVFLDDDISVRPGSLAALAAPVRADPRVVTSARVLAPETPPGSFVPSTKDDPEPASYRGRVSEDVLFSAAMGISRSAFDAVGGFDERFGPGHRFPAAEDNDLGLRLLEAGHTIVYVPEAEVVHDGVRPISAYRSLRWDYGFGMGGFYAKHARLRDGRTLRRLGSDLATYSIRAARFASRRSRAQTSGDLVYCAALLAGAARWWLRGGATGPGEVSGERGAGSRRP